jgi:3-methyladenine DNA glycosylase AlkD
MAAQIRRVLKDGGSAPRAEGVQHFFQDEVQSRGWRTRELRKLAVRFRRAIQKELDSEFLLPVADSLFAGRILEEKVFAVLMLEKVVDEFGDAEFRKFESWLPRICTWADHDALVHYLIAPMIIAKPARIRSVFRWATSRDRWRRRAACVALIQGTRRKLFFPEIARLSGMLLSDEDDMVQKGLGWLLRETAKADATRAVPYLVKIRNRAPRLVLRTACETLPRKTRIMILTITA